MICTSHCRIYTCTYVSKIIVFYHCEIISNELIWFFFSFFFSVLPIHPCYSVPLPRPIPSVTYSSTGTMFQTLQKLNFILILDDPVCYQMELDPKEGEAVDLRCRVNFVSTANDPGVYFVGYTEQKMDGDQTQESKCPLHSITYWIHY